MSGLAESREPHRGFIRNATLLGSATMVSQAILFVCAPLLSRVYTPVDFGHLANYNAWVSILALLSDLRYEHAILISKGRLARNRTIALSLALSLGSVSLYAALAGFFYIAPVTGEYLRQLRDIALFVPLGVLVVRIISLLNIVNTRIGRFKLIAVVAVVQVIGTVTFQLALGLARMPHALVVGVLAGGGLSGALYVALFLRANRARHIHREMTTAQLRMTAALHLNFPKYTLGADSLGVVVQQFVPVFLQGAFGPSAAGLYAFAVRVVRAPLLVVSSAVSSALRKYAGDAERDRSGLVELFRSTAVALGVIALVLAAVLWFGGEALFTLVFGAQWTAAGQVARVMSPGIMLEFVAVPLSVFLLVTGSQRYSLRIQLMGLTCVASAIVAGRTIYESFPATCMLISLALVVVNAATIIWSGRAIRGR